MFCYLLFVIGLNELLENGAGASNIIGEGGLCACLMLLLLMLGAAPVDKWTH